MEGLSPVVVIGMHRSGTTLMSKLLQKLGVFMGTEKEQNEEAVAFLRTNEWIMSQANATWDNPYNFQFLKSKHLIHVKKVVKKILSSERFIVSYFGQDKNWKDFEGRGYAWGWKDPRNTFTLAVWKDIFPSLKVIHVFRNPVDVAASLKNREKETYSGVKNFVESMSNLDAENLVFGRISLFSSPRVENLEEGVALWKDYVSRALEWEEELKDRVLSIKFEFLLDNPYRELKKIAEFLELSVSDESLYLAASEIRKDRKFAFLGKKKLLELYKKVKEDPLVKKLGYGSIV